MKRDVKKIGIEIGEKVGANRKVTNKINQIIESIDNLDFNYLKEELEKLLDIQLDINNKEEIICFLTAYVEGKNKVRSKNANNNWMKNNKEHSNYLRSRSSARSFIKNKSTLEDLKELESLIKERRKFLDE